MIDTSIAIPRLTDHISKKLFHAIVTECFLEALPFGEMENEDKSRLSGYSMDVLESLHFPKGEETAFDRLKSKLIDEPNENKRYFYENMFNVCTESANKATKRIVESKDNQNKSLEQLLKESGLNADELKEFKENVSTVNIENIAEVINKKVIDTIKDEQKQFQDSEDLSRKLAEAITPEPASGEYENIDENENAASDESDDEDDEDGLDNNASVDGEELEATEGFLSNWKEKRLTREMDIKDINRMDEKIYCEMVGEFVLSGFNDNASILVDDPAVIKAILTFEYLEHENGVTVPKFNNDISINYVTSRTSTGSVTIAQWYHPIRRKNVYAYASVSRELYKNGKLQVNEILMNESKVRVTIHTRDEWNKKLLNFYKKNYRDKTIGTAKESINNFYSINFDGMTAINPISFFGKLNDYAIESCISIKEGENSEIPYGALEKTTFYSNLPFIKKRMETLEDVYESLFVISNESLNIPISNTNENTNLFNKSMMISTIIYTILETLKTLGLYSPNSDDIRLFVDSKTSYDEKTVAAVAKEQVSSTINTMRRSVARPNILNVSDANVMLESLSLCRNIIDTIQGGAYTSKEIIDTIEGLESMINSKISTSHLIPTERMAKMKSEQIDSITTGMNKINFYYGKKPDADTIEMRFDSTVATESTIDVIIRAQSGSVVGKSFISVPNYKEIDSPIVSELKEGYNRSLLKQSGKTIKLIDIGNGGKVELI